MALAPWTLLTRLPSAVLVPPLASSAAAVLVTGSASTAALSLRACAAGDASKEMNEQAHAALMRVTGGQVAHAHAL